VNLGTVPDRWQEKRLHDVTAVEYISWAPLLVSILLLGVAPVILFGVTDPAVATLVDLF
jgi:NADH:ubiquinone oxidoreductase subunit 4 (subunit M)